MNDLPREVKRILISTSNRLIGTQSSHWVHQTQWQTRVKRYNQRL
jgi:hypothetical protein